MDDLISRQAAIDAIMCEPTDAHYPSWYAERLEQLPSAQPVAKDINVPVKDCISRQAALRIFEEHCYPVRYDHNSIERGMTLTGIVEVLNMTPPAQKKGHWIDEGTNYSCSECHRGCWVNSNYCPWCGAQMDGKDGD